MIALLDKYKPWDALCYLVVTTQGLYPCKDWDFVYGLSSTRLGIGAFSTMKFEKSKEEGADAGGMRDALEPDASET